MSFIIKLILNEKGNHGTHCIVLNQLKTQQVENYCWDCWIAEWTLLQKLAPSLSGIFSWASFHHHRRSPLARRAEKQTTKSWMGLDSENAVYVVFARQATFGQSSFWNGFGRHCGAKLHAHGRRFQTRLDVVRPLDPPPPSSLLLLLIIVPHVPVGTCHSPDS